MDHDDGDAVFTESDIASATGYGERRGFVAGAVFVFLLVLLPKLIDAAAVLSILIGG